MNNIAHPFIATISWCYMSIMELCCRRHPHCVRFVMNGKWWARLKCGGSAFKQQLDRWNTLSTEKCTYTNWNLPVRYFSRWLAITYCVIFEVKFTNEYYRANWIKYSSERLQSMILLSCKWSWSLLERILTVWVLMDDAFGTFHKR